MKNFRYKVNLERLRLTDEERERIEKDGQKRLFENMLLLCLQRTHPQGMRVADHRVANRILTKLDAAAGCVLELEEAEFDVLKAAFSDDIKYDAGLVRQIAMMVENIKGAESGNV